MSCYLKMLFSLLVFSYSGKLAAQLCQGSLGDPVVNITFGSGTNPGPALGNTSTNYNYVNTDCPNDGNYTIANSTSGCFGATWYTVTQDHTPGDVNGYMMVVNASFNPGDFFVKTVDGLCPNTTYEFAAWIYNLLQSSACSGMGIKPNITFSIETTSGTVLQSYQTGDIPEGIGWKQYGFFFATPAGINSVVLRMTNNAPGGCGNDLLLDDITFRPCGPLVISHINGSSDSVNVCTGDNSVFTLHADISAGYSDPVYQWQLSTDNGVSWADIAGANTDTYVRPATTLPGVYLYRFTVAERQNANIPSCSVFSNFISVSVNPYPVPAASNRGSCIGDTLFLFANDGITFSWTGPQNFASTSQFPFISSTNPGNNGTYYVKVTSSKGCTTLDSTVASLNERPLVAAGSDQEICAGTSVQLNSGASGTITSYNWKPTAGLSNAQISNPVASPGQTTLYIVTVANNGCTTSDSVLVTVDSKPTADAGPDKVILRGQSVVLNGTVSGTDITYNWTPDVNITETNSLSPVASPTATQVYALHVTSNIGCGSDADSVLVKVYQQLYIPNAFTPNGDGVNDTWLIETLQAYPGAVVKVFNRYGQVVFDNHGKNIYWDGTFKGVQLTTGAYAYVIDLKNNTPVLKGVVYILL